MKNVYLVLIVSLLSGCGTSKVETENRDDTGLSSLKAEDNTHSETTEESLPRPPKRKKHIFDTSIYLNKYYAYPWDSITEDSFRVRHRYFSSNHFYDFLRDSLDSAYSLYDKVSVLLDKRKKEGSLINAVWGNNLALAKRIKSDIEQQYSAIDSARISNAFFEWSKGELEEKCDSLMIKWVLEHFGWYKNRTDSLLSLISAVNNRNYNILRFYLQNGWNRQLNQRFTLDGSGDECYIETRSYNALERALMLSDTASAEILLDFGAAFDKRTLTIWSDSAGTQFIYNKLIEKGYDKKYLLDSSLFFSAQWGLASKTKTLLQLGANPNMRDKYEKTPIFYTLAAKECGDPTKEKYEVLKVLIHYGAEVNIQNPLGQTPLMVSTLPACSDGCVYRVGFTKYLLKSGANLEIKDQHGSDFWDYIVTSSNKPLMEFFIEDPRLPQQYHQVYDSVSHSMQWDKKWQMIFDPDETSF